jgi:hypothetical protein
MKRSLIFNIGLVPLVSFFVSSLDAADTTVRVTANPLWTDSGIILKVGDTVTVHNATGTWSADIYQSAATTGPDGYLVPCNSYQATQDEWVTDCHHGQLIGFIGANPYSTAQNASNLFAIGTSSVSLTGKSGELWFGFNDDYTSGGAGVADNGGGITVVVSSGCPVNATAVKMFDSHTLEIELTGQFSNNPLSQKNLSVTSMIGGVPLTSLLPLPSGSTGTQSKSLFLDLAANSVPRFTGNAHFSVTAGMSESVNACTGSSQAAIVLLPVVLIPGILNGNGGDAAFPVLEPFMINTSGALLTQSGTLGEPYKLTSSSTSYPTLYAVVYDTTNDSFDHGASRLSSLINQIKTLTYADRVNLIAHSKGGLVGRQYIVSSPGSLAVNQFIMCETPNAGAIIAFGSSQLDAALRNLAPVWAWERENQSQQFRGTPNPELDNLNRQVLPRDLRLSILYSTSVLTPVSRTGVLALMTFNYEYLGGDGLVPAFSMLGFNIDPNDPAQPPVPIVAFSLLPPIPAFEIDGGHSGYLESAPVMAKVLSLVIQ